MYVYMYSVAMEGSRAIRLGIEQFFWRLMAWLQEVAELGGKSQAFRLQSGSLTDMFLVFCYAHELLRYIQHKPTSYWS